MLIEYAISAGEGTLIDYGHGEITKSIADLMEFNGQETTVVHEGGWAGWTSVIAPASPDCTTGE